MIINVIEAKEHLEEIVQMLIDRKENEIFISKNGIPVVKLSLASQGDVIKKEADESSITKEEFKDIVLDYDI